MRLQLLNENVSGKDTMTAEQFKQREIENALKGEPVARDTTGVEWLREHRGVKCFEDFPYLTKRIYLNVAECFPGVQVYAVGSRVRGDYVDCADVVSQYVVYSRLGKAETGNEQTTFLEFVRLARNRAGMKFKQESDFDFLILDSEGQPVCELPENTERVRVKVPKEEMIEIPIYENI